MSNYYTLTGSGRIKSLGFPNKYDNDLDISTPIEVAEGNRIQLYFYNFDIEDDDTCSYDYVSGINIWNIEENLHAAHIYPVLNTDNSLMMKKCGSRTPGAIISSGNEMTVNFHSDFNVRKSGFKAKWEEVTSTSVRCGNHFGASCSECGPNRSFCYGDCFWKDGKCVDIVGP